MEILNAVNWKHLYPLTDSNVAFEYILRTFYDFLDKVQLSKLNITESNECDNELSEKELYLSLMSMQKNKSPGND